MPAFDARDGSGVQIDVDYEPQSPGDALYEAEAPEPFPTTPAPNGLRPPVPRLPARNTTRSQPPRPRVSLCQLS